MPENIKIGLFERWWLLRHSNPKSLNEQLGVLNSSRVSKGETEIAYLIPHLVANDLRSTMYHYIFIKSTEDGIRELVGSEWNHNLTNSLRLCLDHSGEPLWANQRDMNLLVLMMERYCDEFEVTPNYETGSTLKVKLEEFRGYDFRLKSFSGKGKAVKLTLEFPLCNGRLTLRAKRVKVSDEHLPLEVRRFLSPEYVAKMEKELVAIAARRLKPRKKPKSEKKAEEGKSEKGTEKKPTEKKKDDDELKVDDDNLNNFHYLNFMELDESDAHKHLQVLLLLCAALRKDQRTVEALIPVVQLQDTTDPFICAVLYVATHDASWREKAKQYQQTHDDLSEPLQQLLKVIKKTKFRTPKSIKISKKDQKKMTERVRKTINNIKACDISTLTPQAVNAVWDILAQPAYDTVEGHEAQEVIRQKVEEFFRAWQGVHDHMAGTPQPQGQESPTDSVSGQESDSEAEQPLNSEFKEARNQLNSRIRPSVEELESYYHLLQSVYPNRKTADARDYYKEFKKLLDDIYKTEHTFSSSWWRMKAMMEHYYNASAVSENSADETSVQTSKD